MDNQKGQEIDDFLFWVSEAIIMDVSEMNSHKNVEFHYSYSTVDKTIAFNFQTAFNFWKSKHPTIAIDKATFKSQLKDRENLVLNNSVVLSSQKGVQQRMILFDWLKLTEILGVSKL